MDLNGGAVNNNASNARILTQLALSEPKLPLLFPSMAEALAVFVSSSIIVSSQDTPYRHFWDNPKHILGRPGQLHAFNASIITQQYTSSHTEGWQSLFYVILVIVVLVNLLCLIYFIISSGLVTDYTEPQNLFALAVNSPPSTQLQGSCGGGPGQRDLLVPWKVSYATNENHYFFEEANDDVFDGKQDRKPLATGRDYDGEQPKGNSYKRLSTSQGWL
jgi:hypothetical protein